MDYAEFKFKVESRPVIQFLREGIDLFCGGKILWILVHPRVFNELMSPVPRGALKSRELVIGPDEILFRDHPLRLHDSAPGFTIIYRNPKGLVSMHHL